MSWVGRKNLPFPCLAATVRSLGDLWNYPWCWKAVNAMANTVIDRPLELQRIFPKCATSVTSKRIPSAQGGIAELCVTTSSAAPRFKRVLCNNTRQESLRNAAHCGQTHTHRELLSQQTYDRRSSNELRKFREPVWKEQIPERWVYASNSLMLLLLDEVNATIHVTFSAWPRCIRTVLHERHIA